MRCRLIPVEGPKCSSDAAYAETYSVVCNARHCCMILAFCAGPRPLGKLEKLARQRNGARCGKTLRKEKIHGRPHAVPSRKPATNSRCFAVAHADTHTGADMPILLLLWQSRFPQQQPRCCLGMSAPCTDNVLIVHGMLQEELDRLRKQAAERRASHAAEVSLAFAQATAQPQQPTGYGYTAAPAEYQPEAPPQSNEELLRTLKVSWDKQNASLTYTTDDLRQIMSKHGPVEDVVLLESKKRKKGSALIVMQDLASARAASEAVNGSLSNPLLAVPLAKAAAPSGAHSNGQAEQQPSPEAYAPAEPQQQHQAPPAFPLGPNTTPTPPSSPVKVRNPFGGSAAVDQSGFMQPSAQPPAPAFGAAGPALNADGSGYGASAPAARPLFAAGANMSGNAGHFPAGPFGFSSGSYSSFPSAQNGAAGQPGGFGHAHFGPSVQAGVKR